LCTVFAVAQHPGWERGMACTGGYVWSLLIAVLFFYCSSVNRMRFHDSLEVSQTIHFGFTNLPASWHGHCKYFSRTASSPRSPSPLPSVSDFRCIRFCAAWDEMQWFLSRENENEWFHPRKKEKWNSRVSFFVPLENWRAEQNKVKLIFSLKIIINNGKLPF
jgi:hypothetical protein